MTAGIKKFCEETRVVLCVVVLFVASGACRLFFPLRDEAVSASACEVAFGEVELEASTHFRLDIVDFGIAQEVGALSVSHDIDSVSVLDHIGRAGLVQFESELVACAASGFDEDSEGHGRVADLLQIVLNLYRCLLGYGNRHFFSILLGSFPLFNLEGTPQAPPCPFGAASSTSFLTQSYPLASRTSASSGPPDFTILPSSRMWT